jgi:hypothetical protein
VKETPVSEKVVVFQQWKGQVYVATETGDFVYGDERVNGEYEQFLEEEVWICFLTSAFAPRTTVQFL